MLLLGGRDLLLLPAPYVVRLGYARADTRPAGIQNRDDRLVVLLLADVHLRRQMPIWLPNEWERAASIGYLEMSRY
jgi:hypothetical protein